MIMLCCSVTIKSSWGKLERVICLFLEASQELILVLFLVSTTEDNETLTKTNDEAVQSENQEHFPGEVIQQDYHMPDVITVKVQTGKCWFWTFIDTYRIIYNG